MKRRQSVFAVLLLILLAAGASTVSADVPEPDQGFLDRTTPGIRALADSLARGPLSPEGAIAGIHRLLAERRETLHELHAVAPLTDLVGIATQDRYEGVVLEAVSKLCRTAFTGMEKPGEEATVLLDAALTGLPEMGPAPIPLILLRHAELVLGAADSLVARGEMPAGIASRTALWKIQSSLDASTGGEGDPLDAAAGQDIWQSSVILRLRCPKDQGTYRVNYMKNMVRETGNISRLYYLLCNTCQEPRLLEFPLDLVSRLNRMSVRQNQAVTPIPPRSSNPEP